MNIKVAATSESAGSRHTAAIAVVVATVMFAAQFAAAQQVTLKASRVPRVYNALITTDQRLLPSQAEPIVTPVFRPFQFLYEWPEVRYAAVEPYPSSRLAAEAYSAEDGSRSVAAVVKNDRPAVDSTVVKNNRPADSSVPDVPPPPLPVARAPDAAVKKRPEEYPPAPGGFAI